MMTTGTLDNRASQRPDLTRAILRRMAQLIILVAAQGAILFLVSGDWNWIAAWAYLISYLILLALAALIQLPRNADLVAERGEIKENVPGWDKAIMIAILLTFLALLVVGGLDRRFGWTAPIHWGVVVVGWLLYIVGFWFVQWAMLANTYFSSAVRIQDDRGHMVATGGPYRFVRHPGYVGMIVSLLGVPVILGTLWMFVPAAVYAGCLIIRTALEDRMLQVELPGYQEFAQQTRYRLIPGIW